MDQFIAESLDINTEISREQLALVIENKLNVKKEYAK